MKLNANEEYGLRCLVRLGYPGEGGSLTIAEMSQAMKQAARPAARLYNLVYAGGWRNG